MKTKIKPIGLEDRYNFIDLLYQGELDTMEKLNDEQKTTLEGFGLFFNNINEIITFGDARKIFITKMLKVNDPKKLGIWIHKYIEIWKYLLDLVMKYDSIRSQKSREETDKLINSIHKDREESIKSKKNYKAQELKVNMELSDIMLNNQLNVLRRSVLVAFVNFLKSEDYISGTREPDFNLKKVLFKSGLCSLDQTDYLIDIGLVFYVVIKSVLECNDVLELKKWEEWLLKQIKKNIKDLEK